MKDERTAEIIFARGASRENIMVTRSINAWIRHNLTSQMIFTDAQKLIKMIEKIPWGTFMQNLDLVEGSLP